jgi:hypothetical protein
MNIHDQLIETMACDQTIPDMAIDLSNRQQKRGIDNTLLNTKWIEYNKKRSDTEVLVNSLEPNLMKLYNDFVSNSSDYKKIMESVNNYYIIYQKWRSHSVDAVKILSEIDIEICKEEKRINRSNGQKKRYEDRLKQMKEENNRIGKTIIEHLGGEQRVCYAIGGSMSFIKRGIEIAFNNNALNGANAFSVILTGGDMYDLTFFSIDAKDGSRAEIETWNRCFYLKSQIQRETGFKW